MKETIIEFWIPEAFACCQKEGHNNLHWAIEWLNLEFCCQKEGRDNLHWVEAKDGEVPPAALKVCLLLLLFAFFVIVHLCLCRCFRVSSALTIKSWICWVFLFHQFSDWIRVKWRPSLCGSRQGGEGFVWRQQLHVCRQDESQIWPGLPALWWKGTTYLMP